MRGQVLTRIVHAYPTLVDLLWGLAFYAWAVSGLLGWW